MFSTTLADIYPFRMNRGLVQQLRIDERVVENHVGDSQRFKATQSDQVLGTGTRSPESHNGVTGLDRDDGPGTCNGGDHRAGGHY